MIIAHIIKLTESNVMNDDIFQVLLNDCATNACLGGEGVVDKLMSIARTMVISNNAQYTRVLTRTCQLIIAITNNSKAIYPYHLNSVRSSFIKSLSNQMKTKMHYHFHITGR